MPGEVRNVGASVRPVLLRISTENAQNFDLVLTHYAIKRLLYCHAHWTATLQAFATKSPEAAIRQLGRNSG